MFKRSKLAVVGVALGLLAVTGCGGQAGSSGAKQIEISIFAGSLPEASPTGVGVNAMVKAINDSDSGVEAKAFFDTSLGDATTMVQGLQQGTIDIGVSGNSYYSGLVPQIQVFELPFLFESVDEARQATAPGAARDAIFAEFDDTDIVGLSLWEGGMRQLSNNVRPVKSPADLAGIKMRTLPAPIQQAAWSAMGALPQAIDAAELYTALQQGTVQAQENPLYEIVFRKFYEVQPYVSLTSHVYTPFTMAVSRQTWDQLSDEQKAMLKEAAEVGRSAQLAANDEAEASAKQTLLDNGVTIEETVDREAFVVKAKTAWPQFTESYGTELLDLVQAAAAK